MTAPKRPRKGTWLEATESLTVFLAPDIHLRGALYVPEGSRALVLGKVHKRDCCRLLHMPNFEQSWWADPIERGWKVVRKSR